MLSAINALVIDSAKHEIPFSPQKLITSIDESTFKSGELILQQHQYKEDNGSHYGVTIIPYFMFCNKYGFGSKKEIKRLRYQNEGGRYWNCPPDMIAKLLIEKDPQKTKHQNTNTTIGLKDFFDHFSCTGKATARQVDSLVIKLADACRVIEKTNLAMSADGAGEEEINEQGRKGSEAAEACAEMIANSNGISKSTVIALIRAIFGSYQKKNTKNPPDEDVRKALAYLAFMSRKSIPLGLLFLAGEKMEDMGKTNMILKSLSGTGFCREEYVKSPNSSKNAKADVTVFGDRYIKTKPNNGTNPNRTNKQ